MFSYPSYAASGGFKGAKVVLPTVDTGYKSYDKGRLFLPAGENLLANPSFDADANSDGRADYFGEYAVGLTDVVYSLVPGRTGGYCQRATARNASGAPVALWLNTVCPDNAVAAGDILTGSMYIRAAGEGYDASFGIPRWSGSDQIGYAAVGYPVTSEWTRASITTPPCEAGTIKAFVQFAVLVPPGGSVTVDMDDAQLEKSSFATPYFEGSREVSTLRYTGDAISNLSHRAGTIAMQFANLYATPTASVPEPRLFDLATASSLFYAIQQATDGGIRLSGRATNNWSQGPSVPDALSRHSFIGRWDDGLSVPSLDGTAASTSNPFTAEPVTPFTTLAVCGTSYDNSDRGCMYVRNFVASPHRITNAETVYLDAMLREGVGGSDLYKWFQRKGYGGTLILPLENDSKGYIVDGGYGDNYAYTEVAASTDTGYEVYS